MKNFSFIIVLGIFLLGCDASNLDPSEIEPTINIELIDLRGSEQSQKSSIERSALKDIWTVQLNVNNLESSANYSPAAVTVDDETNSQVSFNLALPPDSLYEFEVVFTQGSQTRGRGLVHQFVSANTSTVTIPAFIADRENPAVLFEPSRVIRPSVSSSSDGTVSLIYLGVSKPTSGLAAELEITGIDENLLTVAGPSSFVQEGMLNLLWNWNDSPSTQNVRELGSIKYPTSGNTSFCIEIKEGNARAVHEDASISKQAVTSESCIQFGN